MITLRAQRRSGRRAPGARRSQRRRTPRGIRYRGFRLRSARPAGQPAACPRPNPWRRRSHRTAPSPMLVGTHRGAEPHLHSVGLDDHHRGCRSSSASRRGWGGASADPDARPPRSLSSNSVTSMASRRAATPATLADPAGPAPTTAMRLATASGLQRPFSPALLPAHSRVHHAVHPPAPEPGGETLVGAHASHHLALPALERLGDQERVGHVGAHHRHHVRRTGGDDPLGGGEVQDAAGQEDLRPVADDLLGAFRP